jgi:hypothetical protein
MRSGAVRRPVPGLSSSSRSGAGAGLSRKSRKTTLAWSPLRRADSARLSLAPVGANRGSRRALRENDERRPPAPPIAAPFTRSPVSGCFPIALACLCVCRWPVFQPVLSAVVARAKPTKTPSAPTSGRYSLLSSPPARGVGVRSEVSALLQFGHVPEPGTQNFAPSKCATRSVACFARDITVAAL